MTVGAALNVVGDSVGVGGAGSVVAGRVAAAKVLAKVFLYGPRFLAGDVDPTVTTPMWSAAVAGLGRQQLFWLNLHESALLADDELEVNREVSMRKPMSVKMGSYSLSKSIHIHFWFF